MIGERYAPGLAIPKEKRPSRAKSALEPAIAGHVRLRAFIGQSLHARLSFAMAFVFVALLLYLAQASQISVREFTIADLQQQQMQLSIENADLHATAASLQSLQRIGNIASTRFHMAPPVATRPVWVSPVVPRVASIPRVSLDAAAMKRSEPLAWMKSFLRYLGAQL